MHVEVIVDVCLVIKQRLEELGLEQKDLATAAEVTDSYISQLLSRKKLPPAPDRTDIYQKMAKVLKLPSDRLAKLAELQRREELKRDLAGPPAPMFGEIRELILRKCVPDKEKQVREIFEKQPFGELERLVTQKLLDVIKNVAKEELNSENWVSFLDPLIESWDVDLTTFAMEIVLNRRIASGYSKRFEFVETGPLQREVEPGFTEFIKDSSLSGSASKDEIGCPERNSFVRGFVAAYPNEARAIRRQTAVVVPPPIWLLGASFAGREP